MNFCHGRQRPGTSKGNQVALKGFYLNIFLKVGLDLHILYDAYDGGEYKRQQIK